MSHKEQGVRNKTVTLNDVYPADLVADLDLHLVSVGAKGAWLWSLFFLWREQRDSIAGTYEELGRLWGCDTPTSRHIVTELDTRNVCIVTVDHGIVTLTSRRLARRFRHKIAAARRASKHRAKQRGEDLSQWGKKRISNGQRNARVTRPIDAPSLSSSLSFPKEGTLSPPTPSPDVSEGDGKLPLKSEIYERHPPLRILHERPELRALSLQQYLTVRSNRSPYMDWIKAARWVAKRSILAAPIHVPGVWLDTRLSEWEYEHRVETQRDRQHAEQKKRRIEEVLAFVSEMREKSPDEAATLPFDRMEACSDALSGLEKEFGRQALMEVEQRMKQEENSHAQREGKS